MAGNDSLSPSLTSFPSLPLAPHQGHLVPLVVFSLTPVPSQVENHYRTQKKMPSSPPALPSAHAAWRPNGGVGEGLPGGVSRSHLALAATILSLKAFRVAFRAWSKPLWSWSLHAARCFESALHSSAAEGLPISAPISSLRRRERERERESGREARRRVRVEEKLDAL